MPIDGELGGLSVDPQPGEFGLRIAELLEALHTTNQLDQLIASAYAHLKCLGFL
jgi:hypothetical protein